MPVEDVFTITGRGTVATGRVERGQFCLLYTSIMQEKENPICAYQNLDQQIELIKNELIRYLLFADCGDAVF